MITSCMIKEQFVNLTTGLRFEDITLRYDKKKVKKVFFRSCQLALRPYITFASVHLKNIICIHGHIHFCLIKCNLKYEISFSNSIMKYDSTGKRSHLQKVKVPHV